MDQDYQTKRFEGKSLEEISEVLSFEFSIYTSTGRYFNKEEKQFYTKMIICIRLCRYHFEGKDETEVANKVIEFLQDSATLERIISDKFAMSRPSR